jgi:hypothetical protein
MELLVIIVWNILLLIILLTTTLSFEFIIGKNNLRNGTLSILIGGLYVWVTIGIGQMAEQETIRLIQSEEYDIVPTYIIENGDTSSIEYHLVETIR